MTRHRVKSLINRKIKLAEDPKLVQVILRILPVDSEAIDGRARGTDPQFLNKLKEFVFIAFCNNLDTAIILILDVAVKREFVCSAICEVTKAYALNNT